jgi:hypothetical protein
LNKTTKKRLNVDFQAEGGGGLYRQYTATKLKEILNSVEEEFRHHKRLSDDASILSPLMTKYIWLMESLVYKHGIISEESLVIYELQKMLEFGRLGKKHPLTSSDAPGKPHGSAGRARIEAEAAAVVGCVRAHKGELRDAKWLGKIQEALTKAGFLRPGTTYRPSGPYSIDIIRKWYQACEAGKHADSEWYRGLLSFVHRYESYDPDVALDRLRYCLARRRW